MHEENQLNVGYTIYIIKWCFNISVKAILQLGGRKKLLFTLETVETDITEPYSKQNKGRLQQLLNDRNNNSRSDGLEYGALW